MYVYINTLDCDRNRIQRFDLWLEHRNVHLVSKPDGGNVTEPGVEPTSSGCMTGGSTTHLKRSAVMSGTGIHRLIYREICVAATAYNT